jgi:hypothetical protein
MANVIDPADDPTTPSTADRYRPPHTDPYTAGEWVLVALALPAFLYCISCLSRTPFWMATHASRRKLLWTLIGCETLGVATIAGVTVLTLR